jgi:hypothetical protein
MLANPDVIRMSSNAFWRRLRRDRIQLTGVDHKFSICLFAGSYKQFISGASLGYTANQLAGRLKMRLFSVVPFPRQRESGPRARGPIWMPSGPGIPLPVLHGEGLG